MPAAFVLVLASLLSQDVISARINHQSEGDGDNDAKCNEAVPGSVVSRTGRYLGGVKECTCAKDDFVVAEFRSGELAVHDMWIKMLDDRSFEYKQFEHRRDHICMSRTEQLTRAAVVTIKEAIDFKKDQNTGWVFLGVKLLGHAMQAVGKAFQTSVEAIPDLDVARAAASSYYQSEATACKEAVNGLEATKALTDSAKFDNAVALLTETASILTKQNNRDAARDKAQETRMVMLDMVKSLLPMVEDKLA